MRINPRRHAWLPWILSLISSLKLRYVIYQCYHTSMCAHIVWECKEYHCKGVDKGGGWGGLSPPILAAKINYLKIQETHFIAHAIFHCVMAWVSRVAPPVEKSCLHPCIGPFGESISLSIVHPLELRIHMHLS